MTADPGEVEFVTGTALAIAGVGPLTSPSIAGAIAEVSGGSFANSAIFSGVSFLASAGLLIWLRGRVVGWDVRTRASGLRYSREWLCYEGSKAAQEASKLTIAGQVSL